MIEVDNKLFALFLQWYRDNIGKVTHHTVMIADRINYFNDSNDLIGYISVYIENKYYIKEECYNLLIKD